MSFPTRKARRSPPPENDGVGAAEAAADPRPAKAPQGRFRSVLSRLVATRWRRTLGAFGAGAVLALTLPPFDVVPAILAWSVLLLLVEAGAARARRPLAERLILGGAFGFGYHLAGLWWVGRAFLVDAEAFGALLPLGVVGLPLLLAPFHALAVALIGLSPRTLAWRAIALAVAVAATEWLRGVAFTGFPWNTAGLQLTGSLLLAQGAAVVGVAGLAPAAVLLGAAPAAVVEKRSRWIVLPALAVGLSLAGWGVYRLDAIPSSIPSPAESAPAVRIVQPAVPQHEKWDPSRRDEIWRRLLAMTAVPPEAGEAPGVVVWPETAFPFLYHEASLEAVELAEALAGRTLVTGAVELEAAAGGRRAFNSILTIAPDGVVTERYRKMHLVPFGEFLPLEGLLARLGLEALVRGAGDFVPGRERVALDVPGLPPALPLVCYEVIFAGETVDRGPAPGVILNLTNDAWFGDTPGPRQHLRHAAMRAIETGLPVVRAANNGISAVVDPAGRIVRALPLDARDVLDTSIPPASRSPYARMGDFPLLALLLLALVAALVHRGIQERGELFRP